MTKAGDKSRELKKKEVLDFVDKVSSYLHAKKKKEILALEIVKNNREAEYIRDRIAMVRRHLDEKANAVREIEFKLSDPADKLISLQFEKQTIESEYARLKDLKKDFEKRQAILEEKRLEINDLTKDVQKASDKLKALQPKHEEVLAGKNRVEEEIRFHKPRLNRLEEEIAVMSRTRDIINGIIPESVGADDFPSFLSDDVETTVQKYIAEVNGRIEDIDNEISGLKARIDESDAQEQALLMQKEGLQKRVEELASGITTDEDKESLMTEVSGLEEQRDGLVSEIEMNGEKLKRIEGATIELENGLKRERELESDSTERLTYLTARKREMDTIENIENEMERLKNEIERLNVDAEADKNFLDIANQAKEDVEAINRSLTSAVDGYNQVLRQFDQVVNNLSV